MTRETLAADRLRQVRAPWVAGHRANATIGRALRLTMINIARRDLVVPTWPCWVILERFTFCLAEDEEVQSFYTAAR
jgi:hypothetical protein